MSTINYQQYLVHCVTCEQKTSKKYAREHNEQCKECVTGISKRGLRCPTCGEHTLTPYQKAHHYHCDACTREADPEGHRREVMGLNDGPDY